MSVTSTPRPWVEVSALSVRFRGADRAALEHVDLAIARGERIGLVGDSGSGKSTLALSLARLVARDAVAESSGRVTFEGSDLSAASDEDVRRVRGRSIGFVFQDPSASLNPLMRVEDQVAEAIAVHAGGSIAARRASARERLAEVELDPARVARAYPHELSGGMRQRVQIAIALAHRPALLVLDEPTTALDTVTQKAVLDTIEALRARHGFAIVLVTHDLELAAQRVDRVVVMERGRVVADGPTAQVLSARHVPYARRRGAKTVSKTGAEVPAEPRLARADDARSARVSDADLVLSVRGLAVRYARADDDVLRGVDFDLARGEIVAVVGTSGTGKSTLVRALARLVEPRAGSVLLARDGGTLDLASARGEALRRARVDVGLVFQDPGASLDARWSVRAHLDEARAAAVQPDGDPATFAERALAEVGLAREHLDRRPHELSGGERQRVCWARALVARPRVLLLDEALSSVDPRTRAHLVEVLATRCEREGLAALLVTHDVSLVEAVADRVLVLSEGRVVEEGAPERVFRDPQHATTRALVRARPGAQGTRRSDPGAW